MNNLDLNSQRFILKYIKKDEVEQYKIVKKENVASTREQIQEDIISIVHSTPYGDENQELADDLCQVVVDNFKKLEIDAKKV